MQQGPQRRDFGITGIKGLLPFSGVSIAFISHHNVWFAFFRCLEKLEFQKIGRFPIIFSERLNRAAGSIFGKLY